MRYSKAVLTAVLILASSAMAQTLTSVKAYQNGVGYPVIKTSDVHMAAESVEVIRGQYVHLRLKVANHGAVDLDFNPTGTISLKTGDDTVLTPMDEDQIKGVAKSILRRRMMGVMVAGAIGSAVAGLDADGSAMQAYDQSRSDDMTDAASAQASGDYRVMQETLLRRNTVAPDQAIIGDLYFELPKDVRKSFDGVALLTVKVQDASYLLQF